MGDGGHGSCAGADGGEAAGPVGRQRALRQAAGAGATHYEGGLYASRPHRQRGCLPALHAAIVRLGRAGVNRAHLSLDVFRLPGG